MRPPGTRFLLFPQPPFLKGFEEPEVVEVSSPAGSVGPGPSDDRMYAVYPYDKRVTYGAKVGPRGEKFAPPWTGPIFPPAQPGPGGHFDHLAVGSPEFESAHLFGSVRFVLDVWESYFERPINWHFGDIYERMELAIMPRFPNATMGYGFMEIGGYHMPNGGYRPFSLNFDVLGHEVGHSIIYPIIGLPDPTLVTDDYYGFHESAADMVGLIASLHFDSVVDRLLEDTSGNLYSLNRLNRIAELSHNHQIRVVANRCTLWDFADGWESEHDLGLPMSAAIFDTFVDLFHESLKARGVISAETARLSDALEYHPEYHARLQDHFHRAYADHPEEMRVALLEARDFIGSYMAASFAKLTPRLDYADVAATLMGAEREVSGGHYASILGHNLARRGIGHVRVGPRLKPPDDDSHAFSARTDTLIPPCRARGHRHKKLPEGAN